MAAQADVVDPKSAMTLADSAFAPEKAAAPASEEPKPIPSTEPKPSAVLAKEVPATPAPEQQVRQAPPQISRTGSTVAAPERSPVDNALRPITTGLQHVGSYLGRVVSACQVGFGAGTGGPVLVLAVLGLVAALERRRTFGVRSVTDEDVPEFLYAGEISPPG
jgi:hypothetical protein